MSSPTLPGKTATKRQVREWLLAHRKVTPAGCWEWEILGGYRNKGTKPYRKRPQTRVQGTRYWVTHLSAWLWLGFDLQNHPGLQINHHCDNHRCFSPKKGHMYIGTQADNIHDMYRRGRWISRNPVRGEKVAGAKLKEKDVLKILEMRSQGKKYREISEAVGVQVPQISRICNGKRWGWLTERATGGDAQ